jgi:hypothetical protein
MQVPALLSVASFLAAAALPGALAHGYISDPAAVWTQGYASNGYGSTINSTVFGPMDNSVYGYGPEGTVKYFEAEFPDSGYASLKDFILANQVLYSSDVDPECGLTTYDDAQRSALPASAFEYTGFTHAGPCEFWCDDNKVVFDNDCQTTYPDIPASVPFDATQCAGANKLSVYWIGVHGDPWQVYADCVWLEGGSGSGDSSTGTTTTTTAPAATSAASSTASSDVGADADTESAAGSAAETVTEAPAASADDEYATSTASSAATEETEAPAATEAPATETEAPATDAPAATEKCTASTRRHRRN